jgi:hypothetical protein
MSANQEPWETLLDKLIKGDANSNEQYVVILMLFKGINDIDIELLRDPSIPYSATRLPKIVRGLLHALSENRDPKNREEIAKGLGNLGNTLLHKITKIRPSDTRELLSLVGSIQDTLSRVCERDESGTVRRVAMQARQKITGSKPWWKFW